MRGRGISILLYPFPTLIDIKSTPDSYHLLGQNFPPELNREWGSSSPAPSKKSTEPATEKLVHAKQGVIFARSSKKGRGGLFLKTSHNISQKATIIRWLWWWGSSSCWLSLGPLTLAPFEGINLQNLAHSSNRPSWRDVLTASLSVWGPTVHWVVPLLCRNFGSRRESRTNGIFSLPIILSSHSLMLARSHRNMSRSSLLLFFLYSWVTKKAVPEWKTSPKTKRLTLEVVPPTHQLTYSLLTLSLLSLCFGRFSASVGTRFCFRCTQFRTRSIFFAMLPRHLTPWTPPSHHRSLQQVVPTVVALAVVGYWNRKEVGYFFYLFIFFEHFCACKEEKCGFTPVTSLHRGTVIIGDY